MLRSGKHLSKARKAWIEKHPSSLDVDVATRLRDGIPTRLSSVNGFYVPLMPKVSEGTKEAIQAIMTNAAKNGLEISEAAGQIAHELAPHMTGRPAQEVEAIAQSIAETESDVLGHAGFLEIAMSMAKVVEADHEKSWGVYDDTPCEKCRANQAVGWIPLDVEFPSGDLHAPAHPKCHCGLRFRNSDS